MRTRNGSRRELCALVVLAAGIGCGGGARPAGGDAAVGPGETADAAPAAPDAAPGEPRVQAFLHGGGREDDDIFAAFVEAAGRGHIVTLGAIRDPDSYPDTAWWDGYFVSLGAASAETINTESRADASDPTAVAAIERAAGIFMRGGDQGRYLEHWAGTPIGAALRAAHERGAVIGGSSAGAMIIGSPAFDARMGSAISRETLLDAHDPYLTFADGLTAGLANVIVDTHVVERGRLGRLVGFLLRAPFDPAGPTPLALGLDPRTGVLWWSDGTIEVVGRGAVTVLVPTGDVEIAPGQPPEVHGMTLWQLPAGYRFSLSALRAGDPPVLARPPYVAAVALPGAAPFTPQAIDGALAEAERLGAVRLVGGDYLDAWRDGALALENATGVLGDTLVVTRLFEDGDMLENRVGGMLWALAARPGLIAIGLDTGSDAIAAPPRKLGAGPGYALVLDGRPMTHAGTPPDGWQTAALEGARLHVITEAVPLEP